MDEKTILRVRDFWTSIVLMMISVFFLYKTADIPFLNTRVAGVDSADWYNSAALVPYFIFGCMFILSLILMGVAIHAGGARLALKKAGIGYSRSELIRTGCVILILFSYIVGLVPRVDFIACSALLITALIWGFHGRSTRIMVLCAIVVFLAALYALVMHFPRAQWAKPHDDDWVAVGAFLALTLTMFSVEGWKGNLSRIVKITPVIAVLAPLILVLAMAFGFRQNVPNRTGLLFSKLEYHYYVTVRPMWQRKN
ncbi:MAG: hypothetical protein AAGA53_03420 [Pseudomonadota bacterium]